MRFLCQGPHKDIEDDLERLINNFGQITNKKREDSRDRVKVVPPLR